MNKDKTYYNKNRFKILQKAKEYRETYKEKVNEELIAFKRKMLYRKERGQSPYYNKKNNKLDEIQIDYIILFE